MQLLLFLTRSFCCERAVHTVSVVRACVSTLLLDAVGKTVCIHGATHVLSARHLSLATQLTAG
jgi:hypothetical protein